MLLSFCGCLVDVAIQQQYNSVAASLYVPVGLFVCLSVCLCMSSSILAVVDMIAAAVNKACQASRELRASQEQLVTVACLDQSVCSELQASRVSLEAPASLVRRERRDRADQTDQLALLGSPVCFALLCLLSTVSFVYLV